MDDVQRHLLDAEKEYLAFLADDNDQAIYSDKIKQMIRDDTSRLIVNINHLRSKNPTLCTRLMTDSGPQMFAFQRALRSAVEKQDVTFAAKHEDLWIGLEGSFGARHVTPRFLNAQHLFRLVCVEGIVTKASLIHPKVTRSVHYCPATDKSIVRQHVDALSFDPANTVVSTGAYPQKDEGGNVLETEFGLSHYRDQQSITLQELPEKSPPGQLPRNVEVVLEDDLADQVQPGDRVLIVGVFATLPGKKFGFTSGMFRTVVIACNVKLLSKMQTPTLLPSDVKKIRSFAHQKGCNPFETLANSLAPTIHGHDMVKKAILCLLLGGVERRLDNGSRLRGDINILLIGDPSVAKSQLLRFVLNMAPRAIPTTGRGSTGVGLTAAVTTDSETGERRLEAGAMVLADRGIVCIDEFDKMTDADRTAIHEVMEQGRVTIAKAGIFARLNARCSVLAAANPVYGRYDPAKSPMDNIGLQDSLLSRFDLIFVLLDQVDPDNDAAIADHVLRVHRYRPRGESDGSVLSIQNAADSLSTFDPATANEDIDEDEIEVPVFDKHDTALMGPKSAQQKRLMNPKFMRKYIHVARGVKPQLSEEASTLIAEQYAALRSQEALERDGGVARTQPVTARALETLIRIATAHAKARLCSKVEAQDAQAAIEMVQFAYFKKVLPKLRKPKVTEAVADEDKENVPDEDLMDADIGETRPTRSRKAPRGGDRDPDDPYDPRNAASGSAPALKLGGGSASAISTQKLAKFRNIFATVMGDAGDNNMGTAELYEKMTSPDEPHVDTQASAERWMTVDEFKTALQQMENDDKLMISDDTVYLLY